MVYAECAWRGRIRTLKRRAYCAEENSSPASNCFSFHAANQFGNLMFFPLAAGRCRKRLFYLFTFRIIVHWFAWRISLKVVNRMSFLIASVPLCDWHGIDVNRQSRSHKNRFGFLANEFQTIKTNKIIWKSNWSSFSGAFWWSLASPWQRDFARPSVKW